MDRDTVRGKGDFERMLSSFDNGELDLLVGTQMIAKATTSTVHIGRSRGADFALGFPDFRAAERTFQLLTQLPPRRPRRFTGEVILQIYSPEHYASSTPPSMTMQRFLRRVAIPPLDALPALHRIANVLIRMTSSSSRCAVGRDRQMVRQEQDQWSARHGPAIARSHGSKATIGTLRSEIREPPALNESLRKLVICRRAKDPRTNLVIDVDAISLM